MKITINTEVLNKYNFSLGQFLVLLVSYYNVDCQKVTEGLETKGLVERDLFRAFPPVLSDNTKNLIARIILESDDKVIQSGLDFEDLAAKLIEYYPKGYKPGTTYPWGSSIEEIAQKLRTLIVKYDFYFTEQEAINAVKEYVSAFKDIRYMQLLRNFILKAIRDDTGKYEMESVFMSIIENNREHEDSN